MSSARSSTSTLITQHSIACFACSSISKPQRLKKNGTHTETPTAFAGTRSWLRAIRRAPGTPRLQRVFTPLSGAVLFSGTEPASWTVAGDFATPTDQIFGFVHRREPVYSSIVRSWSNIGLPGNVVSVDSSDPPYGGAHQLQTALTNCTGDSSSNGFFHNCHVADDWMPYLADGTPLFQPTWDLPSRTSPLVGMAAPVFRLQPPLR